jgi:hypothetical protein
VLFCQQAKQASLNTDSATSSSTHISTRDSEVISIDNHFGILVKKNVLSVTTNDIIGSLGDIGRAGLHLAILDLPEVCTLALYTVYAMVCTCVHTCVHMKCFDNNHA